MSKIAALRKHHPTRIPNSIAESKNSRAIRAIPVSMPLIRSKKNLGIPQFQYLNNLIELNPLPIDGHI